MSSEKRNLPASIHQRLLNKAHATGQAFNELIQYYAIERLLYRLSISDYSEQFTLKGALMFNVIFLFVVDRSGLSTRLLGGAAIPKPARSLPNHVRAWPY